MRTHGEIDRDEQHTTGALLDEASVLVRLRVVIRVMSGIFCKCVRRSTRVALLSVGIPSREPSDVVADAHRLRIEEDVRVGVPDDDHFVREVTV